MKMIIHGKGPSATVDTPGDAHFMDCVYGLKTEAPKCAGVESGIAKIVIETLDLEFPTEKGLRGLADFERIECPPPSECPRSKERCLIEYAG